MIGNWLDTLPEPMLDRLLTVPMVPYGQSVGAFQCLQDVAAGDYTGFGWKALENAGYDCSAPLSTWRHKTSRHTAVVGSQYDQLCLRFGIERVNAAVRDRCLRIKASRAAAPPVTQPATHRALALA